MQRAGTLFLFLAFLELGVGAPFANGGEIPANFDSILTFEVQSQNNDLVGWRGGPQETLSFEQEIVHGGLGAARLERVPSSPGRFSTLTNSIPAEAAGQVLELRGYLRTEEVQGFAGLWLREDGEAGMLEFDNMQHRGLRGTTDWSEYSITLPLNPRAREIFFGVLLSGAGKVWADDLRLLVDGNPIQEAPPRPKVLTVFDRDDEFDRGSGVEASTLTPQQIANLVTLVKVWGFLKYHHPFITSGNVHWDYELFRALPPVLKERDREGANARILAWVERQGDVSRCDPCAGLPDDVHLMPRLAWIEDRTRLGSPLSDRLRWIHYNRNADGKQHFVSQVKQVQNPDFSNELSYRDLEVLDAGYRLLALARYWNIIEYWFPYRDVMDEDWDAVLYEFIPRFFVAETNDAYDLELWALITHIHDTHAHLSGTEDVRPPRGKCTLPVRLRFVEDSFVVTGYLHPELGPESGLQVGDVLVALDGSPVDSLAAVWARWVPASNQPRRMLAMAQTLARGECGDCEVTWIRDKPTRAILRRVPIEDLDSHRHLFHDLPGEEEFRLLNDDVAYLKLSRVASAKVTEYVRAAVGTKGWVIDLRNYPSEFVVFALGRLLVAEKTAFARFTRGDLNNPGAFTWTEPLVLQPYEPHYSGQIVILVDEVTLSQAEYTAMALRAAPHAIEVGSTTAGADGNVSIIPLPGGRRTTMSGIGVFYPDKTPTQRVGIVPDIEVHPTVAGIRAGRDEVLEAAIQLILEGNATEQETSETRH